MKEKIIALIVANKKVIIGVVLVLMFGVAVGIAGCRCGFKLGQECGAKDEPKKEEPKEIK